MYRDTDIQELLGVEAGPTSIILAGVHGDETAGVNAIAEILPTISIHRGRVFWGIGNPRAVALGVRKTECDLNRMFKPDTQLSTDERSSYEYSRAQVLKEYLHQADALLDLHTSTTPVSKTFLIAEPIATPITRHLPFPLVVSGLDKVQAGGTDYYMNTLKKPGICAECGYDKDLQAVPAARAVIQAFLVARGHVDGKIEEVSTQKHLKVTELYYSKSDSFTLAREFADFETVVPGEVIGTDGEEIICANEADFILFAENQTKKGSEVFLLGVEEK